MAAPELMSRRTGVIGLGGTLRADSVGSSIANGKRLR